MVVWSGIKDQERIGVLARACMGGIWERLRRRGRVCVGWTAGTRREGSLGAGRGSAVVRIRGSRGRRNWIPAFDLDRWSQATRVAGRLRCVIDRERRFAGSVGSEKGSPI